jgi:hypothetical protein
MSTHLARPRPDQVSRKLRAFAADRQILPARVLDAAVFS